MGSQAAQRTLLGFDFGTGSIGVAIGQELTGTASPLPALKAKDGIPDWDQLKRLIEEWQPDLLVIGLPLNMDGTEQWITARAKKFAGRLHGRFGTPFEMQDERLTTADAKERLFELGGYQALQKDKIDSVSAVLIIESYMQRAYQ
ncbi:MULTISPECIES: Holliday junction resolvase RuvX [Corallincola]|uniref:Putative pre-16S rRNA nuclease n=3 Tax=Corallincola TaxID=1775176 RepID=A0A368N7Y9_9GAMM|nr:MULTISPECIES: Holliday junction resolvase RuvX [Corallincola]RCU45655.1 Holliday junction resolvase RuvX [Corallincola holothuriorum]TAA41778.1 Holliday junction resolvase RuvX [Corallincola spongiicola]TCI02231.1 Holliday junction resolvase RuvX [Corallincola luteus]